MAATFDLLSIAAQHNLHAFIYALLHQLYGAFPDADRPPIREEEAAPVSRHVLVRRGQLACEAFLAPFAKVGGFSYLALRFGGIYGPDAAPVLNSSMMLDA